MRKEAESESQEVPEREAHEHLPEYYAHLAYTYALLATKNRRPNDSIWREIARHSAHPQGSWLTAISRLLFGPRQAVKVKGREGTPAKVRIKGHPRREPLSREWGKLVGEEDSEDAWLAYNQGLREFYESQVKLLEAPAEEEQTEAAATWPEYASEDFDRLAMNANSLQNSVGDPPLMLFYIAEMETLLARMEGKARATDQKYEARLAASLRDICRVHDPSKFSQEQADCLKGCVTALIEGWGKITREKLTFVRTRLLNRGLTWLPVTDKAVADLQEAKTQDLG